jgi:hypothetical protein
MTASPARREQSLEDGNDIFFGYALFNCIGHVWPSKTR